MTTIETIAHLAGLYGVSIPEATRLIKARHPRPNGLTDEEALEVAVDSELALSEYRVRGAWLIERSIVRVMRRHGSEIDVDALRAAGLRAVECALDKLDLERGAWGPFARRAVRRAVGRARARMLPMAAE